MDSRDQGEQVSSVKQFVLLGVLALVGVVVSTTFFDSRSPIASAETRFVEKSERGLNIIPASCASYPHYIGECSTPITVTPTPPVTTPPNMPPTTGGTQNSQPTTPVTPVIPVAPAVCTNGLNIVQYPSCLCPSGQVQSGVRCVPIQCTPTFYCVGNDLHHRGVQCVDDMPPQPCVYGCSGSLCNQPPPGDGKIAALPTLIRKNQTSIVSWQTSGMVEGSCTVREDNPDFVNSSTLPNGSFTTGSMAQQTIYTLTCTKLSGGSFVDRATISIIPIFEER